MTFDEYQKQAATTAIYNIEHQVVYPAMGLANEAGEVLGKVKKIIRDGVYDRAEIAKEVGDVLWYAAVLCRDLDVSMGEVAQMNLDKLKDRQERGVLTGNGDNR